MSGEHRFVRVEVLTGGVLGHCPDPRILGSAQDLVAALRDSTLVAPENPDASSMLRITALPGGMRVRYRDQNAGDRDFLIPDGDQAAAAKLWEVVRDVSARALGAQVRQLEQLGFEGDPNEVVNVAIGPLEGKVRREDIRSGSHVVRGFMGLIRRIGVSEKDRRRIAESRRAKQ